MCVVPMCVHVRHVHVQVLAKARRGHWIPCFWHYMWFFYFAVWVLSTDPGSSARTASTLRLRTIFLALGLPRIFDLTHKPSFSLTIAGEDKETNFYFSWEDGISVAKRMKRKSGEFWPFCLLTILMGRRGNQCLCCISTFCVIQHHPFPPSCWKDVKKRTMVDFTVDDRLARGSSLASHLIM